MFIPLFVKRRMIHWSFLNRIFLFIILLVLFFGALIHFIEPDSFPTWFDGIWWALVTASTVGYGDYAPASVGGRFIAMLLILLGSGFVSTYFVSLASSAFAMQNAIIEGRAEYMERDHIIFVGWNETVRQTIGNLLEGKEQSDIVIVDETLDKLPLKHNRLHFVKGDPTVDETLSRCNIHAAKLLLITADPHKNEAEADMKSVLTLLAAKGVNNKIYAIVEILTNSHVLNAKRAGADEVIQTNVISSFTMTNSMLESGTYQTLVSLLDCVHGNRFTKIQPEEHWQGKPFSEASKSFLDEGTIVLGIKREEEVFINPPLGFVIEERDQFIALSKSRSC